MALHRELTTLTYSKMTSHFFGQSSSAINYLLVFYYTHNIINNHFAQLLKS